MSKYNPKLQINPQIVMQLRQAASKNRLKKSIEVSEAEQGELVEEYLREAVQAKHCNNLTNFKTAIKKLQPRAIEEETVGLGQYSSQKSLLFHLINDPPDFRTIDYFEALKEHGVSFTGKDPVSANSYLSLALNAQNREAGKVAKFILDQFDQGIPEEPAEQELSYLNLALRNPNIGPETTLRFINKNTNWTYQSPDDKNYMRIFVQSSKRHNRELLKLFLEHFNPCENKLTHLMRKDLSEPRIERFLDDLYSYLCSKADDGIVNPEQTIPLLEELIHLNLDNYNQTEREKYFKIFKLIFNNSGREITNQEKYSLFNKALRQKNFICNFILEHGYSPPENSDILHQTVRSRNFDLAVQLAATKPGLLQVQMDGKRPIDVALELLVLSKPTNTLSFNYGEIRNRYQTLKDKMEANLIPKLIKLEHQGQSSRTKTMEETTIKKAFEAGLSDSFIEDILEEYDYSYMPWCEAVKYRKYLLFDELVAQEKSSGNNSLKEDRRKVYINGHPVTIFEAVLGRASDESIEKMIRFGAKVYGGLEYLPGDNTRLKPLLEISPKNFHDDSSPRRLLMTAAARSYPELARHIFAIARDKLDDESIEEALTKTIRKIPHGHNASPEVLDLVRFFLEQNPDLANKKDSSGNAYLHRLAKWDKLDPNLMSLFLKFGANLELENAKEETVVDILTKDTEKEGYSDLLTLLTGDS